MAYIFVRGAVAIGTDTDDTFDLGQWPAPAQLYGGAGNDLYVLNVLGQEPVELAGAGTDTVRLEFDADYTLGANVENAIRTAGSSSAQRALTGNALNNVLTGDAVFSGLFNGGAGADTMIGGSGNDTYGVDNIGDRITESAAAGVDLVNATLSYTLGANVENLTLFGLGSSGTGNALDNAITGAGGSETLSGLGGADSLLGEAGNDTLLGGDGDDGLDGGIGDDRLDGGNGGDTLIGQGGLDTLIGGAGDDSYLLDANVDAVPDVVIEVANGGNDVIVFDTAGLDVSYVLPVNVETLTFLGNADVDAIGNAAGNHIQSGAGLDRLEGLAGNDVLDAGAGVDTMLGGIGNDSYHVENVLDVVVEAIASGTDTVYAQINWTLGENLENLVLVDAVDARVGRGNALANSIIGNSFSNRLEGGAGNDVLDGGTGGDQLVGGEGNDTYFFDSSSDIAIESAGLSSGTDIVFTSASVILTDHIENLTLQGAPGTNLSAIGNRLANVITGDDGDNYLDGGGGSDRLIGGKGDDVYVNRGGSAVIEEALNAGRDLVYSGVSATLAANVEDLFLLAEGGNVNGTGNGLDNLIRGTGGINVLAGGAGNDVLFGNAGVDDLRGDAGNDYLDGGRDTDKLTGGAGNDTFILDDLLDTVIELANGGTDVIRSAVNVDLSVAVIADANFANVENVELLEGARNVVGNALGNFIVGNSRANSLDGGAGNDVLDGGAGADTLTGGAGNDTFVVDSAGDAVIDTGIGAAGGIDLVRSAVTFNLAASADTANVENLLLLGGANVDGNGNDLANTITGNTGNNILTGGAGADTLSGGNGNDTLDGGIGIDSMAGGLGDDFYVVESLLDKVDEKLAEGHDEVRLKLATGSYVLGVNVEDASIDGVAGAVSVTGNALDNSIGGNTLANRLDGAAGNDLLDGHGGADTLVGGSGNDTFVVEADGVTVTELAGGGIDEILAVGANLPGFSLAVAGRTEIENLTIFGAEGGGTYTGNTKDNLIRHVSPAAGGVYDAGLGNDTIILTVATSATVDGGGGTADRFETATAAGTSVLNIDNIETIAVDIVTAASTLSFTGSTESATASTRLALSGNDGSGGVVLDNLAVGFNDVSITGTSRDVTLDYAGAATVGVLNLTLSETGFVSIDPDSVAVITLSDAVTDLQLRSTGGAENVVNLAGTAPGTVTVSGDASLALLGLATGAAFGIDGFTGDALTLLLADASGVADALDLGVTDSSFAVSLDSGPGNALETLNLTVGDAVATSVFAFDGDYEDLTLNLLGTANASVELLTADLAVIDANQYFGDLRLTSVTTAGQGIVFNDTVSKDLPDAGYGVNQGIFTLRFGAGDDTLNLGNNLNSAVSINGGSSGSDNDVLNADVSTLLAIDGAPQISGIETINLTIGAGAAGNLDGSLIRDSETGGTVINVSGGNGASEVTLDQMNVGLIDGSSFSGTMNVFARDPLDGGELNGGTTLVGGGGGDVLSGAGGDDTLVGNAGNDTFTGGGGDDTFVFTAASLAALGVETITDFAPGIDALSLDLALFNDLGAGVVGADELVYSATVPVAGAGNDGKLVYVNAGADWGKLYYNPTGVDGIVQIADLGGGTTLVAGDLTVAAIV